MSGFFHIQHQKFSLFISLFLSISLLLLLFDFALHNKRTNENELWMRSENVYNHFFFSQPLSIIFICSLRRLRLLFFLFVYLEDLLKGSGEGANKFSMLVWLDFPEISALLIKWEPPVYVCVHWLSLSLGHYFVASKNPIIIKFFKNINWL